MFRVRREFVCQTRLKLSWEVIECKPLVGGGGGTGRQGGRAGAGDATG